MKLGNPPIIEAVVDIDCDLPPSLDLTALEAQARDVFRNGYAQFRQVFLHHAAIQGQAGNPPQVSTRQEIGGFQFLNEDGRQIVQVRTQGFSFNRLAPYTTLDEYLPEIERTWRLFVELTAPIRARRVGLQYVNRMPLPMLNGVVELDDYLRIGPKLPDEEHLTFVNFVNQRSEERRVGKECRSRWSPYH